MRISDWSSDVCSSDLSFDEVVTVNLNSMMACALKFRAMLAAAKGSLILLSSTAAYRTTVGNPAYNASKAGILGLTRSLAQAWIGEGIRVNGVAPGDRKSVV